MLPGIPQNAGKITFSGADLLYIIGTRSIAARTAAVLPKSVYHHRTHAAFSSSGDGYILHRNNHIAIDCGFV